MNRTAPETNSRDDLHEALWLRTRGGALEVGTAPTPTPGAFEIVVRARAVAVNPVDAMGGIARRVVYPWLAFPAILGSDVAGEIVAIGAEVTNFTVGDRVTGYAVGTERSRNAPAEGAFQTQVTLMETMSARLPDSLSFADACVLPLALTTAAAGLFERDQLALELPTFPPTPRESTVVIFGAATSVGMNAVQLAHNAGYRVVATASEKNFPLLQTLGADALVDYHNTDLVDQLVQHLIGHNLAGTLAIASGSLRQAIAVTAAHGTAGTRRISSAHPTPITTMRGRLARRRGITVSAIWGGSPKDTFVGSAIWNDYLARALADGSHTAAPAANIVGHGLAAIPEALNRIKNGAQAEKFVVTL
jgi:NADPH:quinone reductase-like Zn-dependent oxidoreductase